MKKYYLFLICTFLVYGQQQFNIPWPSLADSPWPVLRGDMQGTGRSEYVGPRTNKVLWRKDMPLGIFYGPVIGYNDDLFMGERALSPDSVNYFYAVDKNGNNLWTFETQSYLPNNSGPTIAFDSTIYFFSRNEKMYALNNNGSLRWEQNIWANFRPFYPVAKNGDIYVALEDEILVVSSQGLITDTLLIPEVSYAIVFSTGGDTIYFTTGGPMTSGRDGTINAADLNGNIIWSYHFAGNNWGIPLVDNQNKIYVFGTDSIYQGNYFLYCLKPTGEVDWRYQVSLFLDYSAPTIDKNGNIILNARKIINSEERNCIISLDYYGNENWVLPLEGDWNEHYINHGLVCDAEGKIYAGSSYAGNFYCINSNGEVLWTLDLGEYEYDSCPAIGSDGTLYIGTHQSSLFQYHIRNLIAVRDTVTSVEDENPELKFFQLKQNYPNPFNSTTTISYSIKSAGLVTIKVFDIMGKEIAILLDRYQQAGSYDVLFQANNLASGIYFYTLTSGNFMATKKLILLK